MRRSQRRKSDNEKLPSGLPAKKGKIPGSDPKQTDKIHLQSQGTKRSLATAKNKQNKEAKKAKLLNLSTSVKGVSNDKRPDNMWDQKRQTESSKSDDSRALSSVNNNATVSQETTLIQPTVDPTIGPVLGTTKEFNSINKGQKG